VEAERLMQGDGRGERFEILLGRGEVLWKGAFRGDFIVVGDGDVRTQSKAVVAIVRVHCSLVRAVDNAHTCEPTDGDEAMAIWINSIKLYEFVARHGPR
jgi:hypothetical protein